MRSWTIKTLLAVSTALVSAGAMAQTPPAAPAMPATASAPTQSQERPLKAEELEALVASIALYPDTLLAQVLMASTYPLEVVQAERWVATNKNLKGDQLKTEAEKQPWDESVKALVAAPEVLTMMSTRLDWTRKLGDAVLAQQPDVMDAIQRLRQRAQANNKLTSTKEQKVTVRREQSKEYVVIESTAPGTVYVPYYDPAVVYGGWPYPAYPPYWWGYPGYIPGALIATGIAFGAGFALGRWTSGGCCWGGGNFNWNNNNININRGARVEHWQHNPQHRQGVRYNNSAVRDRFGGQAGAGVGNRMDFRGRGGAEVLRPGGDLGRGPGAGRGPQAGTRPADRPGAGSRPGGGKPSAGTRPGGKPSAGTRPSGKPGAGSRPSGGRGQAAQRPAAGNRGGAFAGGSPRAASLQAQRGRASMGGGGPGGGAGRSFGGGGGGGGRSVGGGGGGGRGGGGGGGGRRSDVALKQDVQLLGHLDNGLGFYRFGYVGETQTFVGVLAQEVQRARPDAIVRGGDGYLRVLYDRIGLQFQTHDVWRARGSQIPVLTPAKAVSP